MRYLLPFALAACTSASPALLDSRVRDVAVGGQVFRVWGPSPEGRVEAHRINTSAPPSRVLTLRNAYEAMTRATGCTVTPGTLQGDQAIQRAKVRC
ncbi:hypothetical protein ACP2AV_10170 [Aliiroseovarius sp. PTFE2010]|uniref:hypothetical protein n=1 Tax=Aliiroseovarius sp. PTFE2010 TaxID=3417190 RepID=UPI003CE81781